jgi:orotidine-5'-phosphate decarboxylase
MVREWGEGTEGACGLSNVGVVMGATYPEDAVKMREILPNSWFLVPGFGAQGGGAKDAVVGVRPDGLGAVINNSRGLIYAYRNLKDKEHNFPMLCEPEKCFDLVREKAINDRDALVAAAREAGKWPF